MLPPEHDDAPCDRCSTVSVLILDADQAARERRASSLSRLGHVVQSYATAAQLPRPAELPAKAVLVVRQELPEEPGIKCIQQIQRSRTDIPAILITNGWSSSLAAEVSSRQSVWLRAEPMSDEELHALVDLCSV